MSTEFRKLPSVDQLLSHPQIASLEAEYPRAFIVNVVENNWKKQGALLRQAKNAQRLMTLSYHCDGILMSLANPSLRPVINATGVILHTNLGRAPLSKKADCCHD